MFLRKDNVIAYSITSSLSDVLHAYFLAFPLYPTSVPANSLHCRTSIEPQTEEDVGLLVQVSFYITAFTLPAYQRGSLPRPSKDDSS